MAMHEVTFTTPTRSLGKADVSFSIKEDGRKLGQLDVSNGSVVWFPNGNTYGHKVHWSALAAFMVQQGARSERR